jgi:hypothetical protein
LLIYNYWFILLNPNINFLTCIIIFLNNNNKNVYSTYILFTLRKKKSHPTLNTHKKNLLWPRDTPPPPRPHFHIYPIEADTTGLTQGQPFTFSFHVSPRHLQNITAYPSQLFYFLPSFQTATLHIPPRIEHAYASTTPMSSISNY